MLHVGGDPTTQMLGWIVVIKVSADLSDVIFSML